MHTKRAEYSGINFGNISFCRTLYKVDKVPVAEYQSVSEVPGDSHRISRQLALLLSLLSSLSLSACLVLWIEYHRMNILDI